jgi:hypothetical protein
VQVRYRDKAHGPERRRADDQGGDRRRPRPNRLEWDRDVLARFLRGSRRSVAVIELARIGARPAPGEQQLAVRRVFVHARVTIAVGHIDVALRRHRGVGAAMEWLAATGRKPSETSRGRIICARCTSSGRWDRSARSGCASYPPNRAMVPAVLGNEACGKATIGDIHRTRCAFWLARQGRQHRRRP